MRLAPGSRVGPYEILARIGAGGMGEVFRAKDTRLNRTVAIKILTGNVDRRRFEQEARAVSGLNHPNICAMRAASGLPIKARIHGSFRIISATGRLNTRLSTPQPTRQRERTVALLL